MVIEFSNLVIRDRWVSGPLQTCFPTSPLGSGPLACATSARAGTWGCNRSSEIAQTWYVGKYGQQDHFRNVPNISFWVQSHWQVQHMPVEVHGDELDVWSLLKFEVKKKAKKSLPKQPIWPILSASIPFLPNIIISQYRKIIYVTTTTFGKFLA